MGKFRKFAFLAIAENTFLEALFLHVIFVIFCYQVICFRANLISNVALVLKGRKILLQSFLIRLGENFLGVYLLLVGLFFLDGKDKQEKFR